MRRRKKNVGTGFLDPVRLNRFVDPGPLIEAEFTRAKRELLASFEKDMTLLDRIRFRIELLRLRRDFEKIKNDVAKW